MEGQEYKRVENERKSKGEDCWDPHRRRSSRGSSVALLRVLRPSEKSLPLVLFSSPMPPASTHLGFQQVVIN